MTRISAETLAAADRHYACCMLCEHRCGVDRTVRAGRCHASKEARVFRHRVECHEEQGLNPCLLFNLSGCDLRCVYCINELSSFDSTRGSLLTPEFFRQALAAARSQNIASLQWEGGEPTVHLPAILHAMAGAENLPLITWKTDLHSTPETLDMLYGIADVYIADFKFGNNQCAHRLCGIHNYCDIIQRNLLLLRDRGRIIIRHLLLPGHEICCWQPIARWIASHMPEAEVSIRSGYMPRWRAMSFDELTRPLPKDALPTATSFARTLELRIIT